MNRETQDKIWALLTDKQRQEERNGWQYLLKTYCQKRKITAYLNPLSKEIDL